MHPHRAIGAFDLHRLAGSGGMGVVWRATHRSSGRPVALKVLTDERARERHFGELFRHEVRAVAALDHPRIVTVFDHGVVPAGVPDVPAHSPFLVMEWADGGSLFGRMPLVHWAEARRVLLALLDAFAHAHARGVLHRDLKPGNVLRVGGPDADWKLADFGIARILSEPADEESAGATAGTPLYMSPEQARGADAELGPWSDLYGLGCLAWELVSGAPPFPGSAQDVRSAHVHAPVPTLRSRFDVPNGLGSWLRQLLAKSPEARFQFAAHAHHALLALDSPRTSARAAPSDSFDLLATDDTPDGSPALAVDWRPEPMATASLPVNTGLGLLGLRPVPLTGRLRERDALWAALRDALTHPHGGGVALIGPSGVGKSRLAAWIAARAHGAGVARWVVATHAPTDGPQDGIEAALSRPLGRSLPREQASAPERLARLLPCLEEATLRRPLVLWVDDVVWSPDDLALLQLLQDRGETPRGLFVVLTAATEALVARPAAAAALDRLVSGPTYRRIDLAPLDEGDRGRLVEGILGLAPDVAAAVSERTGGNPLFAVQLVRSWTERGLLAPGPRGYQLTDPAAGVPADLSAIWRERLNTLFPDVEPTGMQALELAAVLGLRVDTGEWRDACALSRIDPRPDLIERLAEARLAFVEPGTFGFTHALFREALIVRAGPRNRAWNAACARMVEAIGGQPERVGRHRLAGGDPDAAISPLLEAATRRRRIGDLAVSLALLADAIEALLAAGRPESDERWGLVWDEQSQALRMRGDDAEADAIASRNLSLARTHRWRLVRPHALFNRAEIARAQGRYDDAVALAETAVAAEGALGPDGRPWTALGSLAMCRRAKGDLAGAERAAAEALPLARAHGDSHNVSMALLTLATLYGEVGRAGEARALVSECAAICDRDGGRMLRATALSALAHLESEAGDLAAAEANFALAGEEFRRCGHVHARAAALNRVRVLLLQGRVAEAKAALAAEAGLVVLDAQPGMEMMYEVLYAAVDATEGSFEAFLAHFERVDHLHRKLGSVPTEILGAVEEVARRCDAEARPERAAVCRERIATWTARAPRPVTPSGSSGSPS